MIFNFLCFVWKQVGFDWWMVGFKGEFLLKARTV